jgi:hypothetical protein
VRHGYGAWQVEHDRLPQGLGLLTFAGLLEQVSGQVNNVATNVNSVQQSLIGARRFSVMWWRLCLTSVAMVWRNARSLRPLRQVRTAGAGLDRDG